MENINHTTCPAPPLSTPIVCPECLTPTSLDLPVEPLYDLKLAAQLIPTSYGSLRDLLSREKDRFPRRYRRYRQGNQVRLYRMLTASEIRYLRERYTVFKNPDRTPRRPTPHGT